MNYTLMPSLEHIALTKIAVTLWNQDDIRALTARFNLLGERQKEWQVIEDKVIEKVPELLLPESQKKKVLNFIKPIGLEILKWRKYHDQNFYLGIDLPNELCWTPQGTVDKKKTAEILIKDQGLYITRRYKLACVYCLEDEIPKLWNKIPENRRKYFYREEDPRNVRQQELAVLWTYGIKGAMMDNMTERRFQHNYPLYKYAFRCAAVRGNKVATEYFFQKLTHEERKASLVNYIDYIVNRHDYSFSSHTNFPEEDYADVLCFLLSQMSEEQQTEVFKSYSYEVLKCLLDWPWQSFFMKTANFMWDFLSGENYNNLLEIITYKVLDGYRDYNYQKLFGEFWQHSSNAHKRCVIDKCASWSLLSKLLKIKDKENIKLILKDATLLEREKIISSNKGKSTCESLIYADKWNLLKFFFQECISSKDIMVKFKKEFKQHIVDHRSQETLKKEKDMWIRFFQLLDDLIYKDDKKRIMEEDDSSPFMRLLSPSPKRLHTVQNLRK